MIPWIQVYSNLITHPKTAKLAEELKLPSSAVSANVIAAGILVALWTWAIQNAYDGDLSASSASAIADACRWKKKPQTLLDALIGAGFIDEDGHIHDWEEYAVLILEQEDNRRAKTRERVSRYRERKKAEDVTLCNCYGNGYGNGPVTRCNAPTIPNHTRPNLTIPDQENISAGGGDISPIAGARDRAYITGLTRRLFDDFVERWPTKDDERRVFEIVTRSDQDADGNETLLVDNDAADLLTYAFRAAADAGKPGDWRYIRGVLRRLSERGIRTADEADDYDFERDAI